MRRRLWYCDHIEFPLPAGHRFPVAKYRMVREILAAGGLFDFAAAPAAPLEIIELAHDPEYVRRFASGTLGAQAMRRIGFPWSEGLVQRTLASVGATLQACQDALDTGWGGTLAGGTHHAFRGEGSGFCVFNDIAVAIRRFSRRSAVIDLDVHQGDGTAQIFETDPEVFTLSIHGERNFPFRKQLSKLDVGLADGTGDEEYLRVLEESLPKVFAFGPRLIFYQSGVDSLGGDTLGRLNLTIEGLARRDRMVLTACREAGCPVVITLGGGYSNPIDRTAEAHAQTFASAARIFDPYLSSLAIIG
jgi:acetoin utilization deacetylase AcuC-like enzyme